MSAQLNLIDNGMPIDFTVDDIMKYHGPDCPGGVAHAVKGAFQPCRPSPDSPAERRDHHFHRASRSGCTRHMSEAVARAVTEERFTVDLRLQCSLTEVRPSNATSSCSLRRTTAPRLGIREGFVTLITSVAGRIAPKRRTLG